MECKHCGSYMESDAPYCKKCGMAKDEISTKEQKIKLLDEQVEGHIIKKNKGNNPILVFLIIVTLIPIIYLSIILYNSLKETSKEIENNQKENAIKSAIETVEAGKKYATEILVGNSEGITGNEVFECNGKSCFGIVKGVNVKLVIQGKIPSSGKIKLDKLGNATIVEDLVIDEYICKQEENLEINCTKK